MLSELVLAQCVEYHDQVVVVIVIINVEFQQGQLFIILLNLYDVGIGGLDLLSQSRNDFGSS